MTPPGSKSITNRLYVMAALASGVSRLRAPLRADDTDRLLASLQTLGAGVAWQGDEVTITGVSGRFPRGGRVDLGDGGTPTRFMIAAACLAAAPVVVDGSARMRERPVAEGVELLRRLGADIVYVEAEGRLPIEVRPAAAFRGGSVDVGMTRSSQFLSALLLIGPHLEGGIELRYTGPVTSPTYVTLTLDALRQAGCVVERAAGVRDAVDAGGPRALDATIEPDASSAAYWLAAAAMNGSSSITVRGLPADSIQPDMAVAHGLVTAGAGMQFTAEGLTMTGADELTGFDLDCAVAPDGALALAAAAATTRTPTRLRGLHTLRVKETDRITALAAELRAIGCGVEASDDELIIDPRTRHRHPVTISTYRDHRMAMAFGILGLHRGHVAIEDPRCVEKSYPGFWADLGDVLDAGGRPGDEG
ncbi:MAG: 3-phosphoshikimate 1-carboxyvinyltransferase [Phycisphaerales bacterium]|nr:3-phosphoshikimate 1-carboxyvinyltransferase [Phycisphaerales bacterium]NNM24587.1 3-phosphoshikimate 1-carboxyvinyltransferase [Phycisphaerales bacterium]